MASNAVEKRSATKRLVPTHKMHGNHGTDVKATAQRTDDIKHIWTEEGFTRYEEVSLLHVMTPIYRTLGIFGLLWKSRKHMMERRKWTFDLCTLHSCIVILFTWLNVVRCFANYSSQDVYGARLFTKICYHMADLQFACGISSLIYFKHKHVPTFIGLWESYKIKHGGVLMKTLKRNMWVRLIVINLVVLIASVVSSSALLVINPDLLGQHHLAFVKSLGLERPLWVVVVYTLVHLYITMAWLQALIMCLCNNVNLKQEFLELSSQLKVDTHAHRNEVSSSRHPDSHSAQYTATIHDTKPGVIEHYRQRYTELCHLVSKFDDVVSSYLLFLYLFSVPAIIFLVYALTGLDNDKQNNTLTEFLVSVSSLFYYVFVVVSVTGSASGLTMAAQQPKETLHSLDLSTCSADEISSLQIFLHKISIDHVGLTVWKFVNIDKRMLITMFTIVLTYLALLLKMALAFGAATVVVQISASECPCLNVTTTPIP